MESAETTGVTVRRQDDGTLQVELAGDWLATRGLPGLDAIEKEFATGEPVSSVRFETAKLGRWDSGLLVFLSKCEELCRHRQVACDSAALPDGARHLLRLTRVAPEKKDTRREAPPGSVLRRIGEAVLRGWEANREMVRFVGESALASVRLLRGRAQFRWRDAALVIQQCGPDALGIVALINFLVGMILAFVGAVQLMQFGASVYVADLVAIATVREMGCIMTGIIICGRTGASFAAELGTMKVTQEIDALKTFGVSPVEFLVLPRVLALVLMMPLLTVFADVIAIAGGFAVATMMLDITATEYLNRSIAAISLQNFLLGVFKGGVFGALVALTGCLRGMQCGRDAAAVGLATTAAVVAGITSIIAADGVFAVICNALGI
jgi:phospholipid/cholesterol/gamma-HCH transport system permease protein